MIKNILLVGLGGSLGSMLRYASSLLIIRFFGRALPIATFIVNILGCFLAGLFYNWLGAKESDHMLRMLLIIGFCGGFTTFSAFAVENIGLLQNNQFPTAILYVLLSVVTGFAAVYAGMCLK